MKFKLDLVELEKSSGATDGQDLNLTLLLWLKEWVMVTQWEELLPENR
jgi:hypothetical protein